MKQDGMYRYCIQFRAHTESEIRAGELLEKLGRKKSAVIIAALLEYMDNHPELTDGDQSHVTVNTMSLGALEAHISRLIEEKLRSIELPPRGESISHEQAEEVSQDIMDMLDDLNLFNM